MCLIVAIPFYNRNKYIQKFENGRKKAIDKMCFFELRNWGKKYSFFNKKTLWQTIKFIKGSGLAPAAWFEQATNRLTADCSTAELSRNNTVFWRPVPESNRCTRICSPLHEPLCQPADGYRSLNRWVHIYNNFFSSQYLF